MAVLCTAVVGGVGAALGSGVGTGEGVGLAVGAGAGSSPPQPMSMRRAMIVMLREISIGYLNDVVRLSP